MNVGVEWLVEAEGCNAAALRDARLLCRLCDEVLADAGLNVVGAPLWHQFPPPGGVTGIYLLSESHLACHTYPEHGVATFNLYSCRDAPRWPWEARLREELGAERVSVRTLPRGEGDPTVAARKSGALSSARKGRAP